MAEMKNNVKTSNTLENLVKEFPNIKLSEREVEALLEVLEDDEENEKRERKLKLKIIAFLKVVFSKDKFIQILIEKDKESLVRFLETGIYYAQLDEKAPDWIRKTEHLDYSGWLEVFHNLSKNDYPYLRYLIVWGYKDYLENKQEELEKLRKKLAMEEEEYKNNEGIFKLSVRRRKIYKSIKRIRECC